MLMLVAVLGGICIGFLLTLAIQWYLFYYCFLSEVDVNKNVQLGPEFDKLPFQLPQEILKILDFPESKKKESSLALNLIFQFLFKELKDTISVRRWFMKKLSVEFEELLQKTTTGKLLEQITVRDLHLGHQFPVIKSVSVKNVQLHDSGHIEELDIVVDLDYAGGFQLAVDADMVLGRSAFLAVRVSRIQGQARLQLTRLPYTHWSFSFCSEPLMDFQVESHFQGRPLPQVTSLIINQIRRTIRKRHTLPNYKIRYKPFFVKPETSGEVDNVSLLGNKITEGVVDVTVLECSRLFKGPVTSDSQVYCTLAIDSTAWVEFVYSCNTSWVTRDLDLVRQPGQTVGITYKQEFVLDKYEHCVVVETVVPNSPASLADIRRGDIVVAVNGSKVAGTGQATKLFKQAADKLTVRIERRSAIKLSFSQELLFREDATSVSSQGDFSESLDPGMGKTSPPSQSPAKRLSQSEKNGSQSHLLQKAKGALESSPLVTPKKTEPSIERSIGSNFELPRTVEVDGPNGGVTLKRTSTLRFVQAPSWHETFTFEVMEYHKFLNLCVWCRTLDQKSEKQDKTLASRPYKDLLLGHVSILLLDIVMECTTNSQCFHQRTFQLLPPEPKAVAYSRNHKLAAHPGFDETLCYGDVTLSFVYKPQTITKQSVEKAHLDVSYKDSGPESDEDGFLVMNDSTENERPSEHDFIITQFHSTVSCHFCGKKIWLKVAFQCRSCALVCHKKCVGKCQAATSCCSDGVKLKLNAEDARVLNVSDFIAQPEIITTDVLLDQSSDPSLVKISSTVDSGSVLESPRTQRRLHSLLTSLVNASHGHQASPSSLSSESSGLIRAGSVHNLAPPPHQSLLSQSKSLPPSPQTSPAVSRKTSLQGSLFQTGCDSESEDDMETTVQRLLQHSNDEMIVSVAKEKGRDLFTNYSLRERKEKINQMILKLQAEIDQETENRNLLAKDERTMADTTQKARLAILIAKSDEKFQALAILMLYYCSGLQHCQELEESLKAQAAEVVSTTTLDESSEIGEENVVS